MTAGRSSRERSVALPRVRSLLAFHIFAASVTICVFASARGVLAGTTPLPCPTTVSPYFGTGPFKQRRYVIPGRYIVVLKPSVYQSALSHGPSTQLFVLQQLATRYGFTLIETFEHALPGGALIAATDQQAVNLEADSAVKYVEPDEIVVAATNSSTTPWDLIRISQRKRSLGAPPAPNIYSGKNVHVFVVDTAIRASHNDFDPHQVDSTYHESATTCDHQARSGHGTGVASLIGGQTYGVARKTSVHSVQVLDCNARGDSHTVIEGIESIETLPSLRPALVNLSLQVCDDDSQALDDAIRKAINVNGLTFVIAAGNNGGSASTHSPSKVEEAIVVGASTEYDGAWSFSNLGSNIALFAPGSNVTVAWNADDADYQIKDGTSFAAPIVTGIAALYLQKCPNAKPAEVKRALISNATVGELDLSTLYGSPNRLAYMRELPACPNETPPP
jgi:subtilisin family serine protease